MFTTLRRSALAGVVALLTLAACSSTSEQVQDQIAEQVQEQLDLEELPTVTCPDDAESGEGETFACTLELEGTEIPIDVEFSDDTNFTSEVRGAVYQKEALDQGLLDELNAQDLQVESVSCPGEQLVVAQADEPVECDATDTSGTEATLTVELDGDGGFEVTAIEPKG